MRQLSVLITQIRQQLNSYDNTNSPKFRQLAEEYCEYCKIFNEKNEKCKKFAEQGMIAEGIAFAEESSPTLGELLQNLNFPERSLFFELFKMYDWEEPEITNSEVMDKLMQAMGKAQNLTPLIAGFRKIARTDNLSGKLLIAKQIVEQDPASKEWQQTVNHLETELFAKLSKAAQTAIINNDYDTLEGTKNSIESVNWTISINPAVLEKIKSVLLAHHQAVVLENARAILEEINTAYGAFDFSGLDNAISSWNDLMSREDFIPDEAMQQQFNEANTYLEEQKKAKAEEAENKHLLNDLKIGLERGYPIERLEKAVTLLRVRNQQIPEQLMRAYMTYRNDLESIHKRKMLLLISGGTAALLILIGITAYAVYHFRMSDSETLWAKRVNNLIEERKLEDADNLLAQLAKKMPEIRKRKQILDAEARLTKAKAEQDRNIQDFNVIAARIQGNFSLIPSANQKIEYDLSLLEKFRCEPELSVKIDDLKKQFEKKCIENQYKEENQYRAIAKKYKESQKQFYLSIRKEDFKTALTCLENCRLCLRDAAACTTVSEQVRKAENMSAEHLDEMKKKLDTAHAAAKSRDEEFTFLKNAADLVELQTSARSLQKYYPESAFLQKLLSEIPVAQTFQRHYSQKSSSVFKPLQDTAVTLQKMQKGETEFVLLSERMLSKIVPRSESQSMKSFVFIVAEGDRKGKRFEFFFDKEVQREKITVKTNNKESSEISAITFSFSRQGSKTVTAKVQRTPDSDDIVFECKGKTISGKLFAPADMFDKRRSLWRVFYARELIDCSANFKKAWSMPDKYKVLTAFLAKVLNDDSYRQNISPFIRWNIARLLTNILCNSDPANSELLSLKQGLAKFKIPKGFSIYTSYLEHSELMDTIDEEMAKLKVPSNYCGTMSQKPYKIALERKLRPFGFIWKANRDGNITGLYPLQEIKGIDDGELWLIRADRSPERVGLMKTGTADLDASYLNMIPDGTILFCTCDGISSEECWKKLQNEANDMNISKLSKPAFWPVEPKEAKK